MNLAQAMNIAEVVATKIEIRASGKKKKKMCAGCGNMKAECTCDKTDSEVEK